MLSSTATQAHVYPNLKIASLLSIRQLCYSNLSSLFTKKDVTIFNSDKTPVLNGTRNISDGLWDFTIETSQPEPPPTANINQHIYYFLSLENTKSKLAGYLHASAGGPTKSTLIQVINNGKFITFPGLTSKIITKNLPLSLPTIKFNLKREQKNIRSTTRIATTEKPEAEASPTQKSRIQDIFLIMQQRKPEQRTNTHWKISNHFKSHQPVYCHLLRLWH